MDLFQDPLMLLWLLVFLAAAAALEMWARGRKSRLLAAFGAPMTLARLYPAEAIRRRQIKGFLQIGAAAFLFLALARPQWGVELVTSMAQGTQVIVAVDTSLSMLTEDIRPNRMEQAKNEMIQILEGLRGNRIGVIAFAGEAHVQCPLTTDLSAVKSFLDNVRVGMIPQPGTAIGEALDLGTKMLGKYPGHKAIVLLSDGEDQVGGMLPSARAAAKAGIHVYIVGLGTPEGAPIPLKDDQGRVSSYKKDSKGGTVISKLGESGLIQLAAASGGAYYRASEEGGEAQTIARLIGELEKSRIQSGSTSHYKNRYRLPLALALILLFIELLWPEKPFERAPAPKEGERKAELVASGPGNVRTLGAWLLLFTVLPALQGCGSGKESMDLWRGNRDYRAEDFDKALDRYVRAMNKRPNDAKPVFNIGDAQYKLGDFDKAKESFGSLADTAKQPPKIAAHAYYNLGNSHVKKNELKEAAEAYKRCLLIDPSDEDCLFNLVKILKTMKNPQSKSQQQQNQQKQQDKNKDQNGGGSGGKQQNPSKERPQSGMSQEDAERILQAVEDKEKSMKKPVQAWQKKEAKPDNSGADW